MERALRSLGSLNTEPEESTVGKDSSVHSDVLGSEIKGTHLALLAYFSAELSRFPLFDPGSSSLIRNGTPTVVININAFLYKLNVPYPSQHPILK